MACEITKTVAGEKVDFKMPDSRFLEALGEEGIRELMYRFYDKIYESDISNFFPQDEEEFNIVKEKNTLFFIQICGGSKVYMDESVDLNDYMIAIHKDFTIDDKARGEWLGCMRETLDESSLDEAVKEMFWEYVERFSKLTVNSFPTINTLY
jgi:hemoglobin